MLKNYIKISVRNLVKNKVYVMINIIGLGLAMACCIVAYLNSQFDSNFDNNHVNLDHIYKVHAFKAVQGQEKEYGISPRPLGPAIASDLTGIDRVFRYTSERWTTKDETKEKTISARVGLADKGFLKSFSFPLITGSSTAFHGLEQAIVTQEYARKFFRDSDPLGKVLTIYNDEGLGFNFVIGGVVKKAPQNSSIQFDVLLNFENLYRFYNDADKSNWGRFVAGTFLYFNDHSNIKNVESQLSKYVSIQNEERPDWKIAKYTLTPMRGHGHRSRNLRSEWFRDAMHPAAVITPPVMAGLILLIACFNFTNTVIATSNKRLKEIGIRKVLGGSRRQLIIQFMAENVMICILAILLSLGIAYFLVPAYSAMWEGVELEMSFISNIGMYGFLFGMLLFTALLAGLYPSLYISSYEPVAILRGTFSIGGTSLFSKILLTAQFSFTVLSLFASIAFVQNAYFQDEMDMGFNLDQIIAVRVNNPTEYEKIKSAMDGNPYFESVAGASQHIGEWTYQETLKNQDTEVASTMMNFGPNYMQTMDVKLISGRGFSKDLLLSDREKSIIVNEKLVEEFGWKKPLGQRLFVNDSTTLTVIGVIENFYMYGFWDELKPLGVRVSKIESARFIVGKVALSNLKPAYQFLESSWNEKIPNKVFSGYYQDSLLDEAREVNGNILILFSFLGVIAVVLSCIGLFTLVSLNIIKRVKEIGVRKVLGGSTAHIVELINREFLVLLLLSAVAGVTMGYYLIDLLIASIFVYYKEVDLYTFLIPALLIIVLSMSISSMRIWIAAVKNPIESLRYE